MSEPTRCLLLCAAALLDRGRIVDRLSRPLTAAALIGILAYPAIVGPAPRMLAGFAMLVALSGLAEAYLAMRVGFDAALFHQLAGAPEAPDFAATDAALVRLGLIAAAAVDRPVEARVAGATRLLGCQVCAAAAQVVWVLADAAALSWR